MFPQSGGTSFSSFWDKSLKEGVYYKAPASINVSFKACLLYTSDAADERSSVDLGGRRIIKKKTSRKLTQQHVILKSHIRYANEQDTNAHTVRTLTPKTEQ